MAWKFGDIDFSAYNVYVSRSQGILDLPKLAIEGHNWLDNDGSDYWQSTTKYSSREIILNCWLYIPSGGYAEFREVAEAFVSMAKVQGLCEFETPFITIGNCCIERGISIARETSFSAEKQAGAFTLSITVRGDADYELVNINHRTGSPVVAVIKTSNLQVSKSLQGDSYATCTAETSQLLNVSMYDYVNINSNGTDNEKYYFATPPELVKQSTNKFIYNIRLEHGSTLLKDSQFMFEGESDFQIFADLETLIDLIITNADRNITGKFKKGTIAATIKKNHTFSSENCYDVLKRLVQEYKLEYHFELVPVFVYYNINVSETIGIEKEITLEYGRGYGLYELTRETPNRDELCTVLYAFGAAKNLKWDYQSGKKRLVCPGNPLEQNVSTYGKHEKTVYFDDVYPQRTAAVTGYYQRRAETKTRKLEPGEPEMTLQEKQMFPAGFYIIEDTTLDFDLKTHLLDGITAKLRMKTGPLAGMEFEIERYEHVDVNGDPLRYIFLIPFIDETGYEFPNYTLQIEPGNLYTLIDIKQPETYVNTAEADLLVQATDYLAKYSSPIFPYRCVVDPAFVIANNIGFDVGDKITVVDTQLGIDALYRISSLSYSTYTRAFTLQLSDTRILGNIQRLKETVSTLQRAANSTSSISVEKIRKSMESAEEVKVRLLDPADHKLSDRAIRDEFIDPRMLGYDAGIPQFYITDALVEANVDSDYNKVKIGSGRITISNYAPLARDRYEINKYNEAQDLLPPAEQVDVAALRHWSIAETVLTLATDNAYYLYAKVSLTEGETTAELFVLDLHKEVKREIADNFLIYKLGFISSAASPRHAAMLWGNVKRDYIPVALQTAWMEAIYMHPTVSDISEHNQALPVIQPAGWKQYDVVLDLSPEVLIAQFVTDAGYPGGVTIVEGFWVFETYIRNVNRLASTNARIEVLKSDADDEETLVQEVEFSIKSDFEAGPPTSAFQQIIRVAELILLATDRLIFRYYVQSDWETVVSLYAFKAFPTCVRVPAIRGIFDIEKRLGDGKDIYVNDGEFEQETNEIVLHRSEEQSDIKIPIPFNSNNVNLVSTITNIVNQSIASNNVAINILINSSISDSIAKNHESYLEDNILATTVERLSIFKAGSENEFVGEFKAVVLIRDKVLNKIDTLMNIMSYDWIDPYKVETDNAILTNDLCTLTLSIDGATGRYKAVVEGMSSNPKRVHFCFERCTLGELADVKSVMQAQAHFVLSGNASLTSDFMNYFWGSFFLTKKYATLTDGVTDWIPLFSFVTKSNAPKYFRPQIESYNPSSPDILMWQIEGFGAKFGFHPWWPKFSLDGQHRQVRVFRKAELPEFITAVTFGNYPEVEDDSDVVGPLDLTWIPEVKDFSLSIEGDSLTSINFGNSYNGCIDYCNVQNAASLQELDLSMFRYVSTLYFYCKDTGIQQLKFSKFQFGSVYNFSFLNAPIHELDLSMFHPSGFTPNYNPSLGSHLSLFDLFNLTRLINFKTTPTSYFRSITIRNCYQLEDIDFSGHKLDGSINVSNSWLQSQIKLTSLKLPSSYSGKLGTVYLENLPECSCTLDFSSFSTMESGVPFIIISIQSVNPTQIIFPLSFSGFVKDLFIVNTNNTPSLDISCFTDFASNGRIRISGTHFSSITLPTMQSGDIVELFLVNYKCSSFDISGLIFSNNANVIILDAIGYTTSFSSIEMPSCAATFTRFEIRSKTINYFDCTGLTGILSNNNVDVILDTQTAVNHLLYDLANLVQGEQTGGDFTGREVRIYSKIAVDETTGGFNGIAAKAILQSKNILVIIHVS